jgi:hypothetical protein
MTRPGLPSQLKEGMSIMTRNDLAAERAAFIAGLRGLADFLAAHSGVPVPSGYHETTILVFPDGDSDAEKRAGVVAAGAALGVRAADPDCSGHYSADRGFGPVTYRALAISSAHRADYAAQMSYYGAVVSDVAGTAA